MLRLLGRPAFDNRPLPADRRGCLLSYLAYSGEWMSRDGLAALFWPESDQGSARRNLRQLLNRTKQLDLAAGLELTSDLARWKVESDLSLFREALAGKDWLLALERYYGDLLQDFVVDDAIGFDNWLSLERENLRNVYREAALRGAALLENSGRYDEACRHLAAILEGDPLAEDVLQLYLRNLYLAGRRDSALLAYRRFEKLLEDELGMDPLRQTTELVATIRAAQPLDTSRQAEHEPPPTVPLQILRPPRVVGREQAVREASSAATPLVLLRGEAGIGKSRLLEELAPGVPAIRCRESLWAVPFRPVISLIHELLAEGRDLPELGAYLPDVARLVPELAAINGSSVQGVGSDPDTSGGDRARLLEALARLLTGIADGGRFGLVVDDLQWADDSTLELLGMLTDRGQVRILGAYRDFEPSEGLNRAVRETRRTGRLTEVEVTPLSDDDLRELLELLDGSPGAGAFGSWLHKRTGGNPMFALETLRSMHESGRLPGDSHSWQEVADSLAGERLEASAAVSDLITGRLERLDEATVRTLEAAAVVGEGLDLRLLSRICNLSEWAVADALAQAEATGLVSSNGFRHDLIRESIYEAIPAARVRLLHGRALESLEAGPAHVSSALLARHAAVAGRQEELVRYSIAAGLEAMSLPAYRVAVGHFRAALEGPANDQARLLALEGLGDALVQLYRCDDARAAYEQAIASIPPQEIPHRARLHRKLHLALARASLDGPAVQALVDARRLLESRPEEGSEAWRKEWIEVLLSVSSQQYAANELDEMAAVVELLAPMAERYGTPQQQSRYYSRRGMLYSRQERYRISSRTLEMGQRALEVLQGSGERQLIAAQHFSLGFLSLWAGERELGKEHLRRSAAFADEQEELTMQMQSHTYLAILFRQEREVEAAEAHAQLALALAARHQKFDYEAAAKANLGWVALARGDREEARRLTSEALRRWQSLTNVRYPFLWLACLPLLKLALEEGDVNRATELAGIVLQRPQYALPDEVAESLSAGITAFETGDAAAAREQLELAVQLAHEHRLD